MRVVLALLLLVLATSARALGFPAFTIHRSVEGVDISIPTTVETRKGAVAEPVEITVSLNLEDLFAKVDEVVRKSGFERDPQFAGRVAYKGTQFSIDG